MFVSKTDATLVRLSRFGLFVKETPYERMVFKGSEDARKFFYLYEKAVTKSLPDRTKAKKIVEYLGGIPLYFYFTRFTLEN